MQTILFIGGYPNIIEPMTCCFFQNLIHSIADKGINCIVISPVSITHYKNKINSIPHITTEKTKNGNSVKVFYPRYISYSSINIGKIKTGRLTEASFQSIVLKTIKKYKLKFDIVYGHFFLSGGLAAVRVGEKYKKPSYIAYGESDYSKCIIQPYGEITSSDIQGLSGIIAVSTNSKNVLAKQPALCNIPIIVAPNGINSSMMMKIDKITCRKKMGIPVDIFVVGFVGSFGERKGDQRLHDAVKQLDNVFVAFAGWGEKHLGSEVVFCERLAKEEIPIFLNSIDVFVLPTLAEGCCNAIIEALACGVPVISSDLEFNDDILTSNNSIRINPRNVDEIRDAILFLRNDPNKRKEMSNEAEKSARQLTIESRRDNILTFMNVNTNE